MTGREVTADHFGKPTPSYGHCSHENSVIRTSSQVSQSRSSHKQTLYKVVVAQIDNIEINKANLQKGVQKSQAKIQDPEHQPHFYDLGIQELAAIVNNKTEPAKKPR